MALTINSSFEEVAAAVIAETIRRKYSRAESVAALSTLIQESGLRMVWSPNKKWFGYAQQDENYPDRMNPDGNLRGFLDRLDAKRASPGASPDPFKVIFWLQQRPSDPSADVAYAKGRKAYYDEIKRHIAVAERAYDRYVATPPPAPASTKWDLSTYGVLAGSNSGGYGGNGVTFPQWVYDLGNAFGLKPSTYPGHQETDRVEAGYARNPQHLNRGIDWAAPGAADEIDRMQRFADYLLTVRGGLEQVIWENPRTGKRTGVAGGADVSGGSYFAYPGGYDKHRNHVHTRQSKPIPLPGDISLPLPTPPLSPSARRAPQFTEIPMFGRGASKRSRPPINFFLHTEEGNGTAKSLAEYCQGQNGVSYHYTLRDRIVYDVVDTDLYSWSVLDANVFSINLCFAGSRAGMSRQEWLAREADIEIAAYLAVQDCRKYGFSTEVLAPDYARQGKDVYAGGPRAGISDHNYVTRELGIGDHHDVGPNFPWDVFTRYVAHYAGSTTTPTPEEGFLMALTDAEQRELLNGVRIITREQTQKHPSRSGLREPGEGLVDTWAGMTLNTDGNVDLLATFLRGLVKHPGAIERLKRVAADLDPSRAGDAQMAQAMLATLQDLWRLQKGQPVTVGVMNVAEPTKTVTVAAPTWTDGTSNALLAQENDRLSAENARLAIENTRLIREAAVREGLTGAPPALAPLAGEVGEVEYQYTTGDHVGRLIDATEQYVQAARTMDEPQRAALAASLDVLGGAAWAPPADAEPKTAPQGSE